MLRGERLAVFVLEFGIGGAAALIETRPDRRT